MRAFYLNYNKCQTLSGKLSQSYYCELLGITDKDLLTAEYALGGLLINIFVSQYIYYISDKEQLIAEVQKVINQWNTEKQKCMKMILYVGGIYF